MILIVSVKKYINMNRKPVVYHGTTKTHHPSAGRQPSYTQQHDCSSLMG